MKTRLETIALVSLLASGLLCSDIKSVAQVTPNSHPTVAEASGPSWNAAEAELLAMKLDVIDQRANWVQETYITDDTDLVGRRGRPRHRPHHRTGRREGKHFESPEAARRSARKFLLLKLSLTPARPERRRSCARN